MKANDLETTKIWLGTGSINIFGLPFAGKDTLAHNLAQRLAGKVISGGDILRSHADQTRIKEIMKTGELFPTDFYLSIILPYISQPALKETPLLLSSVGRWSGEEPTILSACSASNHPIRAVIHLNVDEATVWQRFETSQAQQDRSHRHDDAKHVLEVRLKEYREKTLPVLEFYKQHGLLLEIDGQRKIDDTTEAALEHLRAFSMASVL